MAYRYGTHVAHSYFSDLNVLGQSPGHNMWLLQYTLYKIALLNTDCYNKYYYYIE